MTRLQLGYFTNEIRTSKALRYYGLALSLTHLLTCVFWRFALPRQIEDQIGRICWPYFENCATWTQLIAPYGIFLLGLYFAVSAVATLLFAKFSSPTAAWLGLLAATLLKYFIFNLDYRFMGNYHYMSFIVLFAYLFLPHRLRLIPLLIVGFYVAAGSLKINAEWLSGAALLRPFPISGPLVDFALALVIPLEILVSWFLLSRNKKLFIISSSLFIIFHLLSWLIVGYFYPLIMFLLLSIFPLAWYFDEKNRSSLTDVLKLRYPAVVYAVVLLFAVAQLAPYLKSGDSALTGEGRILALNMLDAKSVCEKFIYARYKDRTEELSSNRKIGVRIHCDPIVFFNQAQRICATAKGDSNFIDIDLILQSRRRTDSVWTKIIDTRNFCSQKLGYSTLPNNPWIFSEREPTPTVARELTPWPKPFVFEKMDDPNVTGEMKSVFRNSVDRTGYVQSAQFDISKIKEKLRLPNGNIGVHGAAKSSPAVDASGIYVGGDSGWFFAYDWNGSRKWSFKAGDAARGIHGTAALDEKSLYIAAYNGRLYKLNKETGRLIWVIDLGDAVGASPVLYKDSVYLSIETNQPNGYLARIKRSTGEAIWISRVLGDQSHSSPTILAEQGMVTAGDNASFVRAFELETGDQVWATLIGKPIKSTLPYYQGQVFVSGWDEKLHSLNAANGVPKWSYDLNGRTRSSPSIWADIGAVVVADENGYIHAVDMRSGKSKWRHKTKDGFTSPSSATIVKGKNATLALLPCATTSICAFSSDGKIKSEIPTKSRVTATPVVFESKLIISENFPGDLVVYDLP